MSRRVAVVGAGIVGLSVAIHLQRAGARTVLFDRAVPSRETSIWNAGVLATSSLISLANPSIYRRLPSILAHRSPGARIDRRALRTVLPWGLRFLAASRPAPSLRSAKALHALIVRGRRGHEELLDLAGAQDLLRADGWMFLHRNAKGLVAAGAGAIYDRFGVRHRAVSPDRLREMEPALRTGFAGATFFPDSAAVTDPRLAMRAYLEFLRRVGGSVEEQEVRRLLSGSEGWRLRTASGEHGPFDDVVVAAGPWTNQVLAPFGHLPLVVERGYLRRYGLNGRDALRRPVYDVEGGYVLSPRPEGVQLSTGSEFTRLEAPPRPDMFLEAERQASFAIALGPPIDPAAAAGNRPSLPDGLPAIGPVEGPSGLWVAAGHQHIGFSTGPASGELLCELLLRRSPTLDPHPFSPSRFQW